MRFDGVDRPVTSPAEATVDAASAAKPSPIECVLKRLIMLMPLLNEETGDSRAARI
jgi:hypothetical protein